jgi:hypothetical protein
LNGKLQLMVSADDVNLLVRNINTIKRTQAVLEAVGEVGLEVNIV